MKELFYEVTFWIGAAIVVVMSLFALGYLLIKFIDALSRFFGNMFVIWEYVVYRKEFENWLVLKDIPRQWRVKRAREKAERKKGCYKHILSVDTAKSGEDYNAACVIKIREDGISEIVVSCATTNAKEFEKTLKELKEKYIINV